MNEQTLETIVSIKSHIELQKAEVERHREFKKLCKEKDLPVELTDQLDAVITVQEEHTSRCESVLTELLKLKEEEKETEEPV